MHANHLVPRLRGRQLKYSLHACACPCHQVWSRHRIGVACMCMPENSTGYAGDQICCTVLSIASACTCMHFVECMCIPEENVRATRRWSFFWKSSDIILIYRKFLFQVCKCIPQISCSVCTCIPCHSIRRVCICMQAGTAGVPAGTVCICILVAKTNACICIPQGSRAGYMNACKCIP